MKLTFQQFSGVAPRLAPRLLPPTLAQEAYDAKLWSGELRPHYADEILMYVPGNIDTIYRYKWKNKNYHWLAWGGDVRVAKGPVYDDENNRLYVMLNDGSGFYVTDSSMLEDRDYWAGLEGKAYDVALPVVKDGRMVVTGTGEGDVESRSYVVSYVRQWPDGTIDVGKASDPYLNEADTTRFTVDVKKGQTVSLGIPQPPNFKSGVNKVYIYRSEVTSKGQALYSFVDEFNVNTQHSTGNANATWNNDGWYTYIDTKPNTELGEAIPSLYWDPPVAGLKGLVSMQNGLFAAYKDSTVYVSDWNAPHAWPYEHTVTVDYPIVGLGSFGNTIVVCTEAAPVLISVQDPTNPIVKAIQENCPCIAARSIVNTRNGVIFASNNGLVLINSTSPTFITEKLITQDEWLPLNPHTLRSAFLDNTYYGFFTTPTKAAAGFLFDLGSYTYSTVYNSIVSSGLMLLSQPTKVVFNDIEQSRLYVCYETTNPAQYTLCSFATDSRINKSFRWKSRINVSPQGLFTLSAARVQMTSQSSQKVNENIWQGKYTGNSLAARVLDGQPINGWKKTDTLDLGDKTVFNYYVDGELRYSREVKDSKPFRLPSGFRGETVEVELKSNAWVHSVVLASSMAELLEGEQK